MRRLTTLGFGMLATALAATGCGRSTTSPEPDVGVIGDVSSVLDSSSEDTLALSSAATSLAQSVDDEAAGPEFIDLAYFEVSQKKSVNTISNCEPVEPGVQECDIVTTGQFHATHVGLVDEIVTGRSRFDSNETCRLSDGQTSSLFTVEADGTFFTTWGDELYFRVRIEGCATSPDNQESGGYWIVHGGTGRFEDASGVMSVFSNADHGYSAGTLRVRADLFDEFMPGPPTHTITPGAAGVQEGDEGEVVVDVPVTLSFPSSEPVTVDWATLDNGDPGVATADVDYVSASGTVTFLPGETTQTVPITINGDTEVEPPLLYGEWGLLQFSNPSPNATIATSFDGLGVFVIIDDD